jgi:hypothetical protein
MYAQRSWLGISPIATTNWQFDDSQLTTPKAGVGAGLGVVYQLQKQHFLMELGVEALYNYYQVGLADSLLAFRMIDTKGTSFVYKGRLYDRKDVSHTMDIRIPIMFGAEFTYVYFLAGAKLHIHLYGKHSAHACLTTSGEYDIFYDEIVNLPSHGFTDAQPIKSYCDMNYNIDLRPTIEVGANLNHQPNRSKIHLGIFVEYGVLNTIPRKQTEELIVPDLSQYMQVDLKHIYATQHASRLNHLSVGMRFKVFLQIQGKRRNNCRCLDY